MAMKTPDWILEGYDSKTEYEKAKGIKNERKKGKIYNLKVCPKCGSDKVKILVGGKEGKGIKGWKCEGCGWKGHEVDIKELDEEEFMKYLDEKGEEVA
jgi:ribosomal protein L37AE/L43A